jgi:hypothetical protein
VQSIAAANCTFGWRVDPAWVITAFEGGEYELSLPPSLRHVEPGKYFFVHGGEVWEDETVTVSVLYGHWAEHSFAMVGNRCCVTSQNIPVYVIASSREVVAWYQTSTGFVEPVVSARSKVDNLEHLASIAMSLRILKRNPAP